jgi:GTP-binding protein HflX
LGETTFQIDQPTPERAFVIHTFLRNDAAGAASAANRLEEAVGLAAAIGLDVADAQTLGLARLHPSTFLGKGAVERLREEAAAADIDVIIFDTSLTPGQQRNLEKALDIKVIDRTALILEIFGARAQTREGRLQVDLAHLSYQRSRLVRSWTHLERQRGGAGFMGGPGERQIELDRRMIDDRIARLKKDLETVRKRRGLQRKSRQKVPYPVVALVGYTNAGKSTLFNRLTGAEVMAADLLFATLDPTMRSIDLPTGQKVILSDTVGFISDLPTQLVAAFRATLEEVTGADVILHVRDVSHPDTERQAESVHQILRELGLEEQVEAGLFEVLNKIDLLDPEQAEDIKRCVNGENAPRIGISALTGEGCTELLELLAVQLGAGRRTLEIDVALADGQSLSWLYDHGEVLGRQDHDMGTRITVALDPKDIARFYKRFPAYATHAPEVGGIA